MSRSRELHHRIMRGSYRIPSVILLQVQLFMKMDGRTDMHLLVGDWFIEWGKPSIFYMPTCEEAHAESSLVHFPFYGFCSYKVFRLPKTLFIPCVCFYCTGSLLVGGIAPNNSALNKNNHLGWIKFWEVKAPYWRPPIGPHDADSASLSPWRRRAICEQWTSGRAKRN